MEHDEIDQLECIAAILEEGSEAEKRMLWRLMDPDTGMRECILVSMKSLRYYDHEEKRIEK